MESRWSEADAAELTAELGQRVYSSRLLGREPSLVLRGGGNTSIKLSRRSALGRDEMVLWVKGSGCDLATIDEEGFAALDLDHVRGLAHVDDLSDAEMAKQLRLASVDPDRPRASVESILHAVLPHRYVDHTHAEALLALSNTPSGAEHVRRALGELVLVIPYARPGLSLARLVLEKVPEMTEATIGLALLHHGLVSFGETASESYERMIALVTTAETYLGQHAVSGESTPKVNALADDVGVELAMLRRDISSVAGTPLVLRRDRDPRAVAFAQRPDVAALSQSGPATPDHVIWTKRVPMLGRDAESYAAEYREYFQEHAAGAEHLVMLDPAPRVVLDETLGLCTVGRTAAEADVAAEIYGRTIDLILAAGALESWVALSQAEIFAVEYWELEQSKLERDQKAGPFVGEIAVVTGAASGIGFACAESLLAQGASVCGIDVNPDVLSAFETPSFLGIVGDVTSHDEVGRSLESCAQYFGGLDMLVLSAGIFPASRRINSFDLAEWRRVFSVNAEAALLFMRVAYPYLALAPKGGRVVVIGSKNVPAPGPGAVSYSASKAALTQIARVAALEWGDAGIRVNVVHPNAVFDTGIWSDDIVAARAEQYGVTPDEYRTANVLGVEITSADVAELVLAMCGSAFAKTTGAQVPVDGGNERVI